jgi:cation diffusion facilitator CzcD-associated flavoprotein CzcO
LLTLANQERVRARAVVIASGARYRRLDVDNLASFEGSCVHYWASPLEGRLCSGQEVALVGGGNSAGQAAVYLSSQVAKVWLIIRKPDPAANMSRYLVERITATPNIEILTETFPELWRPMRPQSRQRNEAIRAARGLSNFAVHWLEEPTMPDDVEGHRRIVRDGGLPIATGENLHTLYGLFRIAVACSRNLSETAGPSSPKVAIDVAIPET